MRPVSYLRATGVDDAIEAAADPGTEYLAGGTTEVDMVRIGVARPRRLLDINDLPLNEIEDLPGGGLRIGALARMSDVARAPQVAERYPMISQALELGASAQLRNMASMGGNLMQRVRCSYFRDAASPCNRRDPGSGCAAINGVNRGHAVLGGSEHCIATHPSDVAVPLVALDAVIHVKGPRASRTIPIEEFHPLPGNAPHREHTLDHGELITAIEIPPSPIADTSAYLKIRDRESYEFALASVAVAARAEDGTVTDVRLALGGVATKPWRARLAEEVLTGGPASREAYERAARAELAQAVPQSMNGFKIELAVRTMVRALETVVN